MRNLTTDIRVNLVRSSIAVDPHDLDAMLRHAIVAGKRGETENGSTPSPRRGLKEWAKGNDVLEDGVDVGVVGDEARLELLGRVVGALNEAGWKGG